MPQANIETSLKKQLTHYQLDFLFYDLKNIKNIDKLISGVFGQDLLGGLGLFRMESMPEEQIKKMESTAFSIFSAIDGDFQEKYLELRKANGQRMTALEMVSEAYSFALNNNKIIYSVDDRTVRGMAGKYLDCDLSSYLFIQLGMSAGLEFKGIKLETREEYIKSKNVYHSVGHYVPAYVENGKVTHYIETTALYGKNTTPYFLAIVPAEKWEKENKKILAVETFIYDPGTSTFLSSPTHNWLEFKQSGDNEAWNAYFDWLANRMIIRSGHFLIDSEEFEKMVVWAKKRWELDDKDITAFNIYYKVLKTGSRTNWRAMGVPSHEQEEFQLYKSGAHIFGKEKLEKIGIEEPSILRKLMNPIDWWDPGARK